MTSGERFSGDDDFRVMKMSYTKNKADAALKAGNAKEAYMKYSECLSIMPKDHKDAHIIYSNRSLAYAKASKFGAALEDAEQACILRKGWDKAWWRKATALKGLKRFKEALEAYGKSHELTTDDGNVGKDYRLAIADVTRCMTREQLADFVVSTLDKYEVEGRIDPPREQSVTAEEKREAMFLHIKAWQRSGDKSRTDYSAGVASWVLAPMSATMAYLQRASMYKEALCFKQVVADTKAALRLERENPSDEGMTKTVLMHPGTAKPFEKQRFLMRPWAWYLQGQGFEAKTDSPERDVVKAAICYSLAAKEDGANDEYNDAYKNLCESLTNAQASEVLNAANDQHIVAKHGLNADNASDVVFQVKGTLRFDCAKISAFNAAARAYLKRSLSSLTEVPFQDILIERVSLHRNDTIEYQFHIVSEEACQDRVERLELLAKDDKMCSTIGELRHHAREVERISVSEEMVDSIEERMLSDSNIRTALVEVSRPNLAMDIPYRSYKLTRSNGDPVERVDKHPFCMARVIYDSNEFDCDVWYQPSDGRCRWRQSASEVCVMVLGIPSGTAACALDVEITSTHVRVSEYDSGRIFLEGYLEERIVPDESAWDVGDEGVVTLFMQKTNLALFASPGNHSCTEWKRLFRDDGYTIKFDDSAKDFSDLPAPILAQHQANSAKDSARRVLDWSESTARDKASERDDLRRRKRQARLAVMRGKPFQSWVLIDREGIPSEKL